MRQYDLFDLASGIEELAVEDGRPKLMPIQQDLLERGRAAYVNGVRRVIWQAPCGSGKTVVASEQTRLALEKDKTVLHIVHRRRLVDQMVRMLAKFGIFASPIMEGRERRPSKVYCASRDTLLAMLKDGQALPPADLIIPDEAHVAARDVMAWYLKNLPGAYWTGFTATPILPDGSSMNPPYEKLVCMGSASDLIKLGRLCPVKVYNPDAVGRRRRKGDKVKPVGDPVAHWRKYADGMPTVVYASTVADSKRIVQAYLDSGVSAEHIDASTPDGEREEIFERSREGRTRVISNCGVLIEGVDLPWLVCCQILRGCNSLVLWIQATGRVMRVFEGKAFGIVLDHSGAAHEFGLPDSDFQWSLEDEKGNLKRNKDPKNPNPVICPACGLIFKPKPACPQCGKVMPRAKRKSAMDSREQGDGVLTEFNERQNGHVEADTLARVFRQTYYMGRAKGVSMGVVAAIFKKKTGKLPWEASLPFALPGKGQWQTPAKEWFL